MAENYSKFLTHDDGKYEGDEITKSESDLSLAFLSINGFPQPIRIKFDKSSNRTVDKWTLIFVDVDRNILDNGRRAILDQYWKQINTRINDGLSKLNSKYTKDSDVSKKGAGVTSQKKKGIGTKGKSKNPYGGKKLAGLKLKNKKQIDTEDDDELVDELSDENETGDEQIITFEPIMLRSPKTEKAVDVLFINCLCVEP